MQNLRGGGALRNDIGEFRLLVLVLVLIMLLVLLQPSLSSPSSPVSTTAPISHEIDRTLALWLRL
jgi:hypothetical protein